MDVVGSESLLYEAELVSIYHEIFKQLGIGVNILINNRKILQGIAEAAGIADKFVDMTVAIDKLDKIGLSGVTAELQARGLQEDQIRTVLSLIAVKSIDELKANPSFVSSESGKKGLEEIERVFAFLKGTQVDDLVFDITLARGLSYYTGCIFEVKVDTQKHPDIKMGSIGGGGRYDNLTGAFGLAGVSGVGVSLGAERIYDVLVELNRFPKEIDEAIKLIFLSFDNDALLYAFQTASKLRAEGISCDVYPDARPMNKQMNYANKRGIPNVAIIGSNEISKQTVMLKNMITGEQEEVTIPQLVNRMKS